MQNLFRHVQLSILIGVHSTIVSVARMKISKVLQVNLEKGERAVTDDANILA